MQVHGAEEHKTLRYVRPKEPLLGLPNWTSPLFLSSRKRPLLVV